VNTAARVISFIFHPLFLATYLFATFALILPTAWAPVPFDKFGHMLLLIFLVTFILPVINIYLFKILGNISSLQMYERKERILPFVFVSAVYCAVTYMIHKSTGIDWSDNFLKFLMIVDALVIVATLVTLFYKISVHSVAMCGLIGIVLPLNKISEEISIFYATLVVIVLAGIVMTCRLQLNAHSTREVLVGALLGLATGFAGVVILF
jgi:hypothetical protein